MSVQYKRPLAQRKKFNNKFYYYQGTYPDKPHAKFRCEKIRANGYNARFVKEPYGGYSVYAMQRSGVREVW